MEKYAQKSNTFFYKQYVIKSLQNQIFIKRIKYDEVVRKIFKRVIY